MEMLNGTGKGRVCVTGASGFVASWIVKRLLSSGYSVVGTVRDPGDEKKVAHLWKLEGAKERLQLMKAELLVEGSFDQAIMGCHGVFHTASPVVSVKSNPKDEILEPAINGTLNVLRSCKRNPSLKRVVLTSSSSAVRIIDDADPTMPLDESVWSSVELCERFQVWYALSKIHSEREAWKFCKEESIDLVTVIPSFVVGPCLSPALSSTCEDILGLFKGERSKFEFHGRMGYVHIDDVAMCHILVYEHPQAHGRYLCSSKVMEPDELASFLLSRYPHYPIPTRIQKPERPCYELNTSKIQSLGFKFKPVEDMFEDCVSSLIEQGYLPPNPNPNPFLLQS